VARTDPPRVLIDACALIAIIKDETGAERLDGLMDMITRGDAQLVESVNIMGEVYKKSDADDPATRRLQDEKLKNIRARLESRDVELLDVTLPIVRKATEFRQTYGLKLPDATHLATALLNKCDWLVTFDVQFPDLDGMRTFRMKHLIDTSVGLPWETEIQDALPIVPDNVVPLRPAAS
jgi:predicted nucleic acid-binding protein